MLNPVDTAAVIRNGGMTGRFPGKIHAGVAWWVGACFVVVRQAEQLAVGHDGQSATAEFVRRFCNGAINAQHYRCTVLLLDSVTEGALREFVHVARATPGAYLSTHTASDGSETVRIRLFGDDGEEIDENTELADIRRMIAEDHVPIPVSDSARGTIQHVEPAGPRRQEASETAE